MRDINIKIKRKDIVLLCLIVVLLFGIGAAIAWGSGNPSLHGHDVGESLPACPSGHVYVSTGSGWMCGKNENILGAFAGGCFFVCNIDSTLFRKCWSSWGTGRCIGTYDGYCGTENCQCGSGTTRLLLFAGFNNVGAGGLDGYGYAYACVKMS